jgi:hypothetical protein
VERRGFEIIPEFFNQRSITSVAESLAASPLRHSSAGIRNALRIDSVRDIAADSRLLDIAKAILGEDAVPFRATLFDKSFRSNWFVAWHQDKTLPVRGRQEVKGWGPWSLKGGVISAQAPAYALEQILTWILQTMRTAHSGYFHILIRWECFRMTRLTILLIGFPRPTAILRLAEFC